jgi:vacuolar-type H+-ATPase subunit E/Vma4
LTLQAKADADMEKQMTVLNAKTKLAEEFDKKEKALATEQRMCVHRLFSACLRAGSLPVPSRPMRRLPSCWRHTRQCDASHASATWRPHDCALSHPCSKASMEENKQRQRLLGARDEYVQRLAADAKSRLSAVASSNASVYNSLLKGLIKQGLERLEGENAVEVRCRPQDLAVAQKAAVAAAQEVAAEARAAGAERHVNITVAADQALGTSAGGVVLAGAAGRIRCNNTLEERLTLCMADLQPVVRDLLFPSARAEPRVKPPVNIAHGHAPAPAPPAPVPAHAVQAKPAGTAAVVDPFGFGGGSTGAAGGAPAAVDPFAF